MENKEINLSDKEKNQGRKKFWAGQSKLMSKLPMNNKQQGEGETLLNNLQ